MLDIPVPRHMLGDPAATVSIWVKPTAIATAGSDWDMFVHVGRNVSNSQFQITYNGNSKLHIGGYDQNIRITGDYLLNIGTWYHLCITVNPGAWSTTNKKIYLNGQQITNTYLEGSGTTNIPDHPQSRISFGGLRGTGDAIDHESHCKMSNMKVYDTALTASEVKTLYDMGRTGSVANPQPLHIAAPLYAPGTIVQVEQSIKTDTYSAGGGAGHHPVSPGNDVPGLAVTIHPKFANSKILVSYTVSTGAYGRSYLRIQRKQGGVTTTIAAPVGPEANTQNQGKCITSHNMGGEPDSQSFEYYDAVGGTEPITYQIQAWTYHSTYYVYVNRGHADGNGSNNGTYWARTLSTITAKEVCQ